MKNEPEIIVSLTSFPAAISYAIQAIRSILNGSVLPDRLVLYLTYSQFGAEGVPQEILSLAEQDPVFEVRNYDTDIRSYRKLIPALQDFPEDVIVTIDDDVLYHRDMLRDLLQLHHKLPKAIIAHRVRKISLHAPYKKWRKYRWYDFLLKRYHFNYLAMPTGIGGVLYPPHALDTDMLNPADFMKWAPTNDDVWFWAAAVSKGTYVVPLPNGKRRPAEIGKPGAISLTTVNVRSGEDRNRMALNHILEHYPKVRERISE